MIIVRLLVFLTVLCLAGAAQAQNVWSTPGSACVPSGATTIAGRHRTNLASVQHVAGATGQIILFCPMARQNVGTATWNLKLTYQDSTGTATTAAVSAQVYQMAIGAATPVLLKGVNSNSSAVTGLNTVSSTLLTHTFDFEANIYWMRVVITRAATGETVIFHAAVLDGTVV